MLRFLSLATSLVLGHAFMVPMAPSKVGMSQVSVVMQVHAGQSVFGGEATRDPAPTVYDPNDPKGKQQAIHKAESFAEYLAKREMQGAVIPTGGNVSPTPAPEALAPPTAAPPQMQEVIPQQGMTFADYMASRGEGAAVAAPPAPVDPTPQQGMTYADYMASRGEGAAAAAPPAPVDPAPQQGMTYADYMASRGEGTAPTAAAAPPAAVDPPTVPPIAAVSAPVAAPIAAPVQMSESELAAQRLMIKEQEAREDAALPPIPDGAAVELVHPDAWANGRTAVVRNFDAERMRYMVWLPNPPTGAEEPLAMPLLMSVRRAFLKQI